MAQVSYKDLQKQNKTTGKFEGFFPLRAVGLGYEKGHKLAHSRGFLGLRSEDLRTVSVTGTLRLKEGGRWRAARAHTLQLRPQDAELALTLTTKQLGLCRDLGLNVCFPDARGAQGSLDLVCYFNSKRSFGCNGRVWVELKAFGAGTFEKSVAELKTTLPERLGREHQRDTSLCAVLLVAARVETVGSGWGKVELVAWLRRREGDEWEQLAGRCPRKGRGRCTTQKKTVRETLEAMEWVEDGDGNAVGYLKHFLAQFPGLSSRNSDQRAATFNEHLKSVGHGGRISQKALPGKCGSPPYVASKDAFRVLCRFV